MRFLLLLCACLLAAQTAFAFCDGWRTSDTALLVPALLLTEVDREQTQWFLRNPHDHETNLLMAGHPSSSTVDATFLAETLAAAAATCWTTGAYRTTFLLGWTGLEAIVVKHNAQAVNAPYLLAGFRLSF